MKIALIEPKSTHMNVYSRIPIPRVGPILLATLAKQQGHEAKVYFEQKEPINMNDVLRADLVGISTLTMTAQRSYDLADRCLERGIPVVIGGIHATFLPEEALQYADFVLRYEAEDSFVELVNAIDRREDPSGIPSLSFWKDGKVFHNPSRPLEKNLDKYPIPDWSLIAGSIHHNFPVISISTARGCPFDCSFCTVTVFNGSMYRFNSIERVLEEISFQRSRHPKMRYLFFADDVFNYNKKRAKDIIRGMIENGLHKGIDWGAQMRHEASRDKELLELMRKSNCDRIFVGFESINQESLKLYGKKETAQDVEDSIRRFHKGGVRIHGMFMAGSDADTVEDVRETSAFVRKVGLDTFQLMVTTPNPGSSDFNKLRKDGRELLSLDWTHFDGHHVVHVPQKITPYELQVEIIEAMKRFYSFPSVIKSLLGRDLRNAALRFIGRGHVQAWKKDPRNLAYLEKLKRLEVSTKLPL